jgi:hypothetical protein
MKKKKEEEKEVAKPPHGTWGWVWPPHKAKEK